MWTIRKEKMAVKNRIFISNSVTVSTSDVSEILNFFFNGTSIRSRMTILGATHKNNFTQVFKGKKSLDIPYLFCFIHKDATKSVSLFLSLSFPTPCHIHRHTHIKMQMMERNECI